MVLVGAVKPLRAAMVVPTQIIAGIAAAAVVDGILPGALKVGNALGDGTRPVQGVFLEMFLTAQLVLTVYFLAVEKHRATYLAPIGIGASVFIAHIAGTNYTGTSVNPARSFGPAVIVGFPGYHWIYWVGPFLGTGLAFAVYTCMKLLDYSTANPGQDTDDIDRSNKYKSAPVKPRRQHAYSTSNNLGPGPIHTHHGKPTTPNMDNVSDADTHVAASSSSPKID